MECIVSEAVGQKSRRHTRQLDSIIDALRDEQDFVSVADLHKKLEDAGVKIGLATVYRRVQALADEKKLDSIMIAGVQRFRLCNTAHHHHHLVCVQCGRTIEVEPPLEEWVSKVTKQYGFIVQSHSIEIYGLCKDCQDKQ
ncbi:MAG: Fur family transcriptional regulator [Bifidobacteriaceae bacterium]|nr:Fur family transcriptional regulator [Bifidobacteriaceae bacterium]